MLSSCVHHSLTYHEFKNTLLGVSKKQLTLKFTNDLKNICVLGHNPIYLWYVSLNLKMLIIDSFSNKNDANNYYAHELEIPRNMNTIKQCNKKKRKPRYISHLIWRPLYSISCDSHLAIYSKMWMKMLEISSHYL